MIRKIARYRVNEKWLDEAPQIITSFVSAIGTSEPGTEYSAFQMGEGQDFVHFIAFPDPESEEKHRQAEYTTEFVKALYPNCVEEPIFTTLNLIAESDPEV